MSAMWATLRARLLSDFRDMVATDIINATGHPATAHAALQQLEKYMLEKWRSMSESDSVKSERFMDGMFEMISFVGNLRADVQRDYGIGDTK